MPREAMDYYKCYIYKIKCLNDKKLKYVGHTTKWDQRKYKHKFNCYNEKSGHYNLKLYQMIRENGGWEKFKMTEVEKYPCNDKREAEKRECEVMKELKASMNMVKSYVSDEECKELKRKCDEDYRRNNMNAILLMKK